MRKMTLICVLILLFLSPIAWAQPHQAATQGAVSLAVRNPWPKQPSSGEIAQAFNDYRKKLAKNVTITSGPTKMHAPWEKDPLSSNKVVLTIRADYKSQPSQLMAVVLKYDFPSSRFKFEGVLLQGVKRYPGDRSTSSYLEPQDLVYLEKEWISYPGRKRTAAVADDVADVVDEYIRQFEGDASCFGRAVKLGDPTKYREELNRGLTVITRSRELGKDANASHMDFKKPGITPPPCELHVPFDLPLNPDQGKLSFKKMQTIYHEATHHIEWRHGVKRAKGTPGAERNTDYLDNLVNALNDWKKYERQVIRGERTPEGARVPYKILEDAFRELKKDYKPDLPQLEAWAGIRIRIEDIRNRYLSRACGEALRKVVENYIHGAPDAGAVTDSAEERTSDPEPAEGSSPHPSPAKAPDRSHIVYAMVYDKGNGRPLEGAAFTVLLPGVTTQQWINSDFDMSLVAAEGVSNGSGMVTLSRNLEKGKTYSFMVARESYRVVRYETLSVTEASPEPLKITVKLTR